MSGEDSNGWKCREVIGMDEEPMAYCDRCHSKCAVNRIRTINITGCNEPPLKLEICTSCFRRILDAVSDLDGDDYRLWN